jgi:hypothetical protein
LWNISKPSYEIRIKKRKGYFKVTDCIRSVLIPLIIQK